MYLRICGKEIYRKIPHGTDYLDLGVARSRPNQAYEHYSLGVPYLFFGRLCTGSFLVDSDFRRLFRTRSFSKYSDRKNVEVKMSKSSPYCVLVKNMLIARYDVFNSDFVKLVIFQIFTSL
jgi:hypothetical protein